PKRHRLAVVGYGPSLRDSWEDLKPYTHIWTVSGAHDFLLERGIIPTYHTDLDYRSYKADFIKVPHTSVKYVMATAVHPDYTAKLKDFDLQLFHCVSPYDYEYRGDYHHVEYGWDCGQQAIRCALTDGWQHIDLYGFDYSSQFTGTMQLDKHKVDGHAGPHGGQRSTVIYVTANNMLFETTQTHLSACFALDKLITEHPELDLQIHSNELLLNFIESRATHKRIFNLTEEYKHADGHN
ncbi:MAG: DUF115 domain-containing protein, partial [Nitrososphaera sp.]|nr:DUF115 domain-containing protein [Nitrososphaera sp.]